MLNELKNQREGAEVKLLQVKSIQAQLTTMREALGEGWGLKVRRFEQLYICLVFRCHKFAFDKDRKVTVAFDTRVKCKFSDGLWY